MKYIFKWGEYPNHREEEREFTNDAEAKTSAELENVDLCYYIQDYYQGGMPVEVYSKTE